MHNGCEGLKCCMPHSLLTQSAHMADYIDGWSDVCSGGMPASCVPVSHEPTLQEAERPAASPVGNGNLGMGGLEVLSDAPHVDLLQLLPVPQEPPAGVY